MCRRRHVPSTPAKPMAERGPTGGTAIASTCAQSACARSHTTAWRTPPACGSIFGKRHLVHHAWPRCGSGCGAHVDARSLCDGVCAARRSDYGELPCSPRFIHTFALHRSPADTNKGVYIYLLTSLFGGSRSDGMRIHAEPGRDGRCRWPNEWFSAWPEDTYTFTLCISIYI